MIIEVGGVLDDHYTSLTPPPPFSWWLLFSIDFLFNNWAQTILIFNINNPCSFAMLL